jgi:hypothetical protein
VVLVAVGQDGNALEYASADLKGDREVVLAAVGQDGNALEYASEELKGRYFSPGPRGDLEVVLAAVAQDESALVWASWELGELVPRLLRVRPFQRLLLAGIECRGADCLTAAPLVLGPHLPLSLDVQQMVEGYLAASCTVPAGPLGVGFAWHEAQVPLADEAFGLESASEEKAATRAWARARIRARAWALRKRPLSSVDDY